MEVSEVEVPVRTRGTTISDETVASAVAMLKNGKAVKFGEYAIAKRDDKGNPLSEDGTDLHNRARNQGKSLNGLVAAANDGQRYGISTWENGNVVIGALLPRPAKVIVRKDDKPAGKPAGK